jgi:hypothetical protein
MNNWRGDRMNRNKTAVDKLTVEALKLSRSIMPLLTGKDPGVIGGALADLVAILIAGHHPSLRDEILRLHIDTVTALIEPSAEEITKRNGGRLPPAWQRH